MSTRERIIINIYSTHANPFRRQSEDGINYNIREMPLTTLEQAIATVVKIVEHAIATVVKIVELTIAIMEYVAEHAILRLTVKYAIDFNDMFLS